MSGLAAWESFIRAVEGGSMAAAARALGCTRAQVSKQIGELERQLGARLIERSTRGLRLTPAGEVFLRHARPALQAVAGAELAVRSLGDTPRGVLRVSATVSFGRRHVAPLLPGLLARHPELECELVLTDHMVDLAADNIDLALRMTQVPPQDTVARKLVDLRRVICASPAYLAAHGEPHTPRELALHQCFSYLLSDERVWRLRDAAGQESVVPIHGRLQFNNPECMLEAVLQGHGIAILPTYLCSAELADGRLHRVLPEVDPTLRFGRHLYACYLPGRARLPRLRAMLALLEAAFRPVPPWERVENAEAESGT